MNSIIPQLCFSAFLALIGLLSIIGSILDWEWLLRWGRGWDPVEVLGRSGARSLDSFIGWSSYIGSAGLALYTLVDRLLWSEAVVATVLYTLGVILLLYVRRRKLNPANHEDA